MKRTGQLILLVFFLVLCSIRSFPADDSWWWLDSIAKPWTLSEEQISTILPQFQVRFPDFESRLKAFIIWRTGTPYEIFKLGEEVYPDSDPIIRLDVSDCTTFVLTSLAFVQSNSWQQARENMIRIHYKPDSLGETTPTYKTRWHFTADRISSNPYTADITNSLLPPDKLSRVDVTLNKRGNGSELLDLNWSRKLTLHYIPNEEINNQLLSRLPEVCGIAFVKKSYIKNGLVISHEGVIIDRKTLIHASQSNGKTARIDFLDYYFTENGPAFDGIVVFKFVPLTTEG